MLDRRRTPRRTREGRLHTREHEDYVNRCMTETPDMSARILKEKVATEFGIDLSISALNVYRRKLGWVQKQTRYCQLIRNVNVEKRREWCETQIRNHEQFDVSTCILYTINMKSHKVVTPLSWHLCCVLILKLRNGSMVIG